MTLELIRAALGWCTIINWVFLLWWWLLLVFAHDLTYRMHSRWFKMTPEEFDAVHYKGMAYYKSAVILLNLAPYLALRIVG
jgi:hypothetical protein